MSDSQLPANDAGPALGENLDPEILALLEFEPVPRKRDVEDAWTPALQREFLVRLAVTGSIGRAAEEMGKTETGVRKLYRSPDGVSFRKSWDGLVALAKRRKAARRAAGKAVAPGSRPPSLDNRFKHDPAPASGEGEPGQVLNEFGEWEDEGSYARRGEAARDSISTRLQRARRLYLRDIAPCPAKRAAFEILTQLPVDWEKAGRCLPQADEPWRKPRARDTDMLLTAEAGWLGAELVHGPDRKAALLAEINAWRAERGLELVGWRGEGGTADDEPA